MYGIKEATRDARRHVLSRTEETKLHAAYMSGDHAAGQRLVNSFLPVLYRSAHAFNMPPGHALDMLGVAVQAFMDNMFRYDAEKGPRIWSYMRFIVRHAVSEYASRNRTFFRIHMQNDRVALTYLETEKKKLGASGRPLTGSEIRYIAAVFGVAEEIIHGFDDDMSIMRPGSLHGDWKAEAHAMDDPERDGGQLDFERRHDDARHAEMLEAGLDLLNARQREIVARRFKEKPDTLQELADEMGVSRERIRQIEGVALRKLRIALGDPEEKPAEDASLLSRRDDGQQKKCGGKQYVASTKLPTNRRTTKRQRIKGPARGSARRETIAAVSMRARP